MTTEERLNRIEEALIWLTKKQAIANSNEFSFVVGGTSQSMELSPSEMKIGDQIYMIFENGGSQETVVWKTDDGIPITSGGFALNENDKYQVTRT